MNLLMSLQRIERPRILVLGDLILDRYTSGPAERVSPEAPVVVLEVDRQEVRLGGAASVAMLSRCLDAEVAVAGIVGDDLAGRTVGKLFDQAGIDRRFVSVDPSRPTTTKERFIGRAGSRHPHQILRVDREIRRPLDSELERRLLDSILSQIDRYQALLISDYNKGVCTPGLMKAVIAAAGKRGLPVIIDPARISDYSRYQQATLLTPNRKEAELATGREINTPQAALAAGRRLLEVCGTEAVLVTLDREGMALVRKDGTDELISTQARSVYDITGAGDMVLAAVGFGLAAEIPLIESVRLGNIAAGLEVQHRGVTPVSRAELQAELAGGRKLAASKLVTLERITDLGRY